MNNNDEFDLKNFRTKIGFSQKELAEAAGISQSTLAGWEQQPENIPFSALTKIANTTGYKVTDMLSFDEKKSDSITKFEIAKNSIFTRETIRNNFSWLEIKNEQWSQKPENDNPDLKKEFQNIKQLITSGTQENKKLNVAFLGKSDAGKSTMINTLVGEDISPSQWQPATSAIIKLVHLEDRPKKFENSNTIIIRTRKNIGFVSTEMLIDDDFIKDNLLEHGDRDLISEYALHGMSQIINEDENDTIFTFIDAPLLKGINIIDTPGIATGEHTKGKKDTKASENTRNEADVFVYTSVSNQFLQGEDQAYLKTILDILPQKTDFTLNRQFSNLFIIASQAHITGTHELEKSDGIFDKALQNLERTLPKDYLSNKNKNFTANTLRTRFFSFSRDDEELTKKFKDDFSIFISSYLQLNSTNTQKKYTRLFKEFSHELDHTALTLLQQGDDLSTVKQEVEQMKKQRTQKHQDIDNFITDGKNKADYYRLQSKEKIKNEYDNIINVDYITELISEKDFKNQKKDKEIISTLVSSTLNEKSNKITEEYSQKFADFLTEISEKNQNKFNFTSFDFTRTFISILAGGTAYGALVFYMSTLGNLGGYILVTQIVGALSAMGISVGGGAVATAFIASIGGPVTLAIGLAVMTTLAAFTVSGLGWKKSFAKKIVKQYEKSGALSEINTSIDNYWEETTNSLTLTGTEMKEKYDLVIEDLKTKLSKSPAYFFEASNKIKILNIDITNWISQFQNPI